MRHVALDVHQSFCQVAIREAGKIRQAGRVATGREALELFACPGRSTPARGPRNVP